MTESLAKPTKISRAQITSRDGGEEEAPRQEGGSRQHEGGNASDQGGEENHPLGSQHQQCTHQENQVLALPQGNLILIIHLVV